MKQCLNSILLRKKFNGKKLICKLLSLFLHKKIVYYKDEISKANLLLSKYLKDTNKSCICTTSNNYSPIYDLQVIIPAYNAEKYIESCINSVLTKQTTYNVLITVINDGSPDNTGKILEKYDKNNKIEIITQKNKGYSGARNSGLSNIKAKYITFLDSDDEIIDFNKALDTAFKTNADIVEGGYIMFAENQVIKTFKHKNSTLTNPYFLYGLPWGKVFNARLFLNICFPENYWFEDTIMSFILYPMCNNKIITIDTIFYKYRYNIEGISNSSKGNLKNIDSFYITRRLLKDRVILKLPFDKEFAEKMVEQIKINYMRISSINNKNIELATFILTIDLWEKHFSHIKLNHPIVNAIKKRDFYTYILACLS